MVAVVLLSAPSAARAEWQITPFVGPSFGGSTTFVDSDSAADKAHATFGASGRFVGELFGFDGDVGYTPGFFQAGSSGLVVHSSVMTLTGNAVVALPKRLSQYSLRPYLVGGAGLMRVRISHTLDVLPVSSNLLTLDVGAGATGFLTRRVGLNWEVRRFASNSRTPSTVGASIGPEDLSFWRASMALAIRLGHGV